MPTIIWLGIILSITGVIFPIYGTPQLFGIARLTLFRFGLLLLFIGVLKNHVNIRSVLHSNAVKLFVLLLYLRILSLTFSSELYFGLTQISWYAQGLTIFLIILALARKYDQTKNLVYSSLIYGGFISGLFSIIQYYLYLKGTYLPLPLSGTEWGGEIQRIGSARIFGTFMDVNMASSFFVLLIAILLPSFIIYSFKNNLFRFLILGVSLIAIFASGSKQALVAFIIILICQYLIIFKKINIVKHLIIICLSIFAMYYIKNIISTVDPAIINYFTQGDLLVRLALAADNTDFSSGRSIYYMDWWKSLDIFTLMLGSGDGTGEWSTHNAYLIVIQENGLLAGIVLLSLTLIITKQSWKKSFRSIRNLLPDSIDTSAILIVVGWISLIAMNWAQLNEPFCWVFLSLAMLPTKRYYVT